MIYIFVNGSKSVRIAGKIRVFKRMSSQNVVVGDSTKVGVLKETIVFHSGLNIIGSKKIWKSVKYERKHRKRRFQPI